MAASMNMKTPTKPGKAASNRKVWFVTGAIAAVAMAGGATFALWPKNYQKLATELAQKGPEELRKAVEAGQIPREVAWEAFGEARRVEFEKRIDGYFALQNQAARTRYLDQMIDEMEAQRRRWEAERAQRQQQGGQAERGPRGDRRPDGAPGEGPATRPANDRERQQRMAARMDARPAARQAQMIEFMAAMRKRMQERGIQPGRGFGGGPGGWGGRGGPGGGGSGGSGAGRGG